jgi:hypothetical protein
MVNDGPVTLIIDTPDRSGAGRDFLVTMALFSGGDCDILIDSELTVPGAPFAAARYHEGATGSYWVGDGQLVVSASSTLQVRVQSGECADYIEGHYFGP